jgi:membrane protease YdiL (CAAX protease family)
VGQRREALKLAGIAALWLILARFLPDVLWRALPRAVLDSLSLPVYGMICQVLTTLVGLGVARLSFARPREALGATKPSVGFLALAAVLAPAIFVVASTVAIKIAEPYLMAELAREGAGASRRNAGAFGQAVTQAPLALTLVWGAVLAAVAEELAFRGALFSAVEKGMLAVLVLEAPSRRLERIAGAMAVVVAAAAFGAMHADMKGSVGIVRVASTTCLGLACGTARLFAGTVFVPMIVHFTYNAISLGIGRGFFRSDSPPLLAVVPNPLLALAATGVLVAVAAVAARRAFRGGH